METQSPTVAILTALDSALSKVRELNPNVPTALAVVIASGKGKFHGVFETNAWKDDKGEHAGSARHELLMSSESFARGAEATLVTLIHEAGHAMAHATGIKDTSRQGRFHNDKFRTIAESMGLTVESNKSIGHTTTGLQSWAKDAYSAQLEALETALVTHRVPASEKPAKPKTTVRVQCGCEAPVTVPIKWWNDLGQDNMTCALCADYNETDDGGHFFPVE